MLDRICNGQNNTTRNNETGRQISIDRAHQAISPNNYGTLNSSDSDAEDLVNYTSLKDDNEYNTNASKILPNSSICIHHRRRQHRQRRIPSVFIIIIIIIEIVIFIIGVTGNIMIVLTILTTKSMHSTQNFFVFNLAITDLVTLVNLPMKIWQQLAPYLLLPGWPFGEFSCIYVVPIFDIFPSVSILTLVAIYIDRYRAITATLATAVSLKYIILLLAANWIGNYLVVGLPVTFVMTYIAPSQCMANFTSASLRRTYFTLRTVLLYVLPSSIIFFCFVRVNKVLGNSMRFLQRSVTGKSQVVRLKRQKRVMTMFFVIFLTFVICYFPYNTLTIVYHYVPSLGQYPELITSFMHVAAMLGIAYSACNSVILYHLSKAFRVKFQKYLPFLKCFTRLEKEDTIDNHDRRHTTIEDLDDGEETKTNRRFSGANLFSSKGGTFKRRFGPKRPHHPNGETQEHELLENNNITNHDL
ncbi:C-X-C chemokine receptor type 1-like [Clytia hemisphaerica]